MKTLLDTITRETTENTDILDITEDVGRVVRSSEITTGIATVFTPGSTAGVTTIEFEAGAIADLKRAIERIAPADMHYDHDARWGDGNGYSHVRSALLGPSITIPIDQAEMKLGTWQQIVVCDFDNRPRTRRVLVQVVGF